MKTRDLPFGVSLFAMVAGSALVALAPACNNEPSDLGLPTPSTSSSGSGGSGGGSGSGGEDAGPTTPAHDWQECQASDQAWVRRAILAITGRRPWGQAEVSAYADAIGALRKADLDAAGNPQEPGSELPPYGEDLVSARKIVAQALMHEDAFRERWSDFFMDSLRVARSETKSQEFCYGAPSGPAVDSGALAAWVRDNDSTQKNPPIPGFTMGSLLSSSLELDDLSPLYRAHLFAMLSRPYDAANVGQYEMERARRQNFGAVFERAYIHRDRVCLSCHNSEFSVTFNDEPAKNRAWVVPGLFEVALYGSSTGMHPPEEQATKGTDELRALSMLRFWGVADGGGSAPYDWDGNACGRFKVPIDDDPLGVDTYFGSIRSTPNAPNAGLRASVWDLERSLHRGVDKLAAHGLTRLPGNALADADEAFAYMVGQNIVDIVWAEVMGSRLTIANYFPRTEVQRDILMSLTEHFVASHFSLKTLLLDILAHPAFNMKAPDLGCGVAAYELPPIFDPWTSSAKDVSLRSNAPGDGVFAISPRALRRGLHRAMAWPAYPEYPNGDSDETLQLAIGFFMKDGEPGFRGLDFQGRLSWESSYGTCKLQGGNDFISTLVKRAGETPGATVGDAVVALKDRLLGEPWIDSTTERSQIEALVKTNLGDTNLALLDARLRLLCGVLVSSPQFVLGGVVPIDTNAIPKLTPTEISYQGSCGVIANVVSQIGAPYAVTCSPSGVTATKL